MFGGLFPVSLIIKYAGYGHPVMLTYESRQWCLCVNSSAQWSKN
jgi:hypothetical protein